MCGNPRDCSFVVRFQVKQSISWQSPHSEGSMKLDVDRSASFSDPDHDVMDTNTAQLYEMKIAMENIQGFLWDEEKVNNELKTYMTK
ncbi:hypothetical protein V6N12_034856 [Hibiscus sabdariffa]|uniref:Uncharacterized protein n=1 Tax=Hibiscus sabdariffa TaxID=183260 RepID=A0ABR2BQB0_9ROSI